jgi:hypothetical protein
MCRRNIAGLHHSLDRRKHSQGLTALDDAVSRAQRHVRGIGERLRAVTRLRFERAGQVDVDTIEPRPQPSARLHATIEPLAIRRPDIERGQIADHRQNVHRTPSPGASLTPVTSINGEEIEH